MIKSMEKVKVSLLSYIVQIVEQMPNFRWGTIKMTIVIEAKKYNGLWSYRIYAGENNDIEEYARSEFEYDTEYDAEMAGLKCISDAWLPYE